MRGGAGAIELALVGGADLDGTADYGYSSAAVAAAVGAVVDDQWENGGAPALKMNDGGSLGCGHSAD